MVLGNKLFMSRVARQMTSRDLFQPQPFCSPGSFYDSVIYLLEEPQPRLSDNFEVSIIRVEHLYISVIDHTVNDNTVPPF